MSRSNPDTWAYGTILRHAPFIPYAPEETLVMFVRWDKKVPVLLILQDGYAPEPKNSMTGLLDAIKIHPKDWEVVE